MIGWMYRQQQIWEEATELVLSSIEQNFYLCEPAQWKRWVQMKKIIILISCLRDHAITIVNSKNSVDLPAKHSRQPVSLLLNYKDPYQTWRLDPFYQHILDMSFGKDLIRFIFDRKQIWKDLGATLTSKLNLGLNRLIWANPRDPSRL